MIDRLAGLTCAVMLLFATILQGQPCLPQWSTINAVDDLNGTGHALKLWDPDGPGPREPLLIVGGYFTAAGTASARGLAAWDGSQWSSFAGSVEPLWDGQYRTITEFAELPNGELIAAGTFTSIGGVPASGIARWDGTTWHPLGSGLGAVNAVLPLPDGRLLVGTNHHAAPVKIWDGQSWQPLGNALNGRVFDLTLAPGGSILAAGELFFTDPAGLPGRGVARWDGQAWLTVGPPEIPEALAVLVRPNGDVLVGGHFGIKVYRPQTGWTVETEVVPSVRRIVQTPAGEMYACADFGLGYWNGVSWTNLIPPDPCFLGNGAGLRDVQVMPNGDVVATGVFWENEYPVAYLQKWNGVEWSSLSPGSRGKISALLPLPDGGIIAGGNFSRLGRTPASDIAVRSGGEWSELGGGMDGIVLALARAPSGDIIAGGYFQHAGPTAARNIARWDGEGWSPLGEGVTDSVYAITILPNGHAVAAGRFTFAGAMRVNGIARWDGAQWHAYDAPTSQGARTFRAVTVLPDGTLVAAGSFASTPRVVRWNGTAWVGMAQAHVECMAVAPNGDLIVGGIFESIGGVPAKKVARWDGAQWHTMGNPPRAWIFALAVSPSGHVVAAGRNSFEWGQSWVMRWNGVSWTTLGVFDEQVNAVAWMNGGDLAVGGQFTMVNDVVSALYATFGCESACYANCDNSVEPRLTVNDLACFLQRYAAGDPWANCDGSAAPPLLNILDFACFLQRFLAGCP